MTWFEWAGLRRGRDDELGARVTFCSWHHASLTVPERVLRVLFSPIEVVVDGGALSTTFALLPPPSLRESVS